MDDFDGEPTTGGGYDRVIDLPIDHPDGIARRIVVGCGAIAPGTSSAFPSFSKSREPAAKDSSSASTMLTCFHRHHPGWPEPGLIAELLDDIEPRQRAPHARDQIRVRYYLWETEVFG